MNSKIIQKQFNHIASQYDIGRKCFIPCFEDYYVKSVSLLKCIKHEAHKIVDLGAGTGLLTQQIFLLYPYASYTLIDLSDNMLDIAKQRFDGLDNFSYRVDDYCSSLEYDADIICSALSIHHLEDSEKQNLYNLVYDYLPKGGVFINLDQFCADSDVINNAWTSWWENYINSSGISEEAKQAWLIRRQLDCETSISKTTSFLRNSGFNQVDCVYQFMKFATIIAVK